jgi:hypothetical protein
MLDAGKFEAVTLRDPAVDFVRKVVMSQHGFIGIKS